MATGRFEYHLGLESGKAQANAKKFSGALKNQEKQAKKTGVSMKNLAIAGASLAAGYMVVSRALRVLSRQWKESWKLGAEQIKQEETLRLKYGESAKALFEQASALQKVSQLGDEVILSGP